ncbi:MAG: hypothetical protein H6825_00425 [Planctomycetes bacterium]|nr:hypothetical protein [Planctomycetota bacterium]
MTVRATAVATACLVVAGVLSTVLVVAGGERDARPALALVDAGFVTSRRMDDLRPTPARADVVALDVAPREFAPRVADDELPAIVRRLANCRTHVDFLRAMLALAGPVEAPDGSCVTRFDERPEATRDLLLDALQLARHPLARQMLVMHVALTAPPDDARQRLQPLLDGDDAGDREDALLALAFRGDAAAASGFVALAARPSEAVVRRPLGAVRGEQMLERESARDVLRSYRALEVLWRRPYFGLDARVWRGAGTTFPWVDADAPSSADEELLLEAWRARYPGHCGSDNVALRLARLHLAAGRDLDALREASRASVEPDADRRDEALMLLVALAEFSPLGSPVVGDIVDPRAPERNADLLLSIRARRYAAELGYAAALDEVARVAASRPELLVSRAYRERWAGRVPCALASGQQPVAWDDPLRRTDAPEDDAVPWDTPLDRYGNETDLDPSPEGVVLDLGALRDQFRSWETMAAFEERERRARGDERLDWAYKRAALYYHSRDVLHPVYAGHGANWSGRPDPAWLRGDGPDAPSAFDWYEATLSWNLATDGFLALVRDDPGHPLADEALFSAGLAQIKAADESPVAHTPAGNERRWGHVARGVQILERLAREYPLSPLADDAAAAARYWRRTRPTQLAAR